MMGTKNQPVIQTAASVFELHPPLPTPPTPALLGRGECIDYSTMEGIQLYENATKALSKSALFDGTIDTLELFLDQLRDRAGMYDWQNILWIPCCDDKGGHHTGHTKNLIDCHDAITYAEVKAHVMSYIHTETREAQISYLLYQCIMKSLSAHLRNQVRDTSTTMYPFEIEGIPSGPLLLKVLLATVGPNTMDRKDIIINTRRIRTQLASLSTYMVECNSNIDVFNTHVHRLVQTLQRRNEGTPDLLFNLFQAYKACRDREFVKYIEEKESLYEEGVDISHEQLMDWALRMFQNRNEEKLWCKTSVQG